MKKSTQRFSDRVESYVQTRPGYPVALIDTLIDMYGLDEGKSVVDIGSGTGILTESLLARGIAVTGIEPNQEMRQAAEVNLRVYHGFESVDGSAEKTGMNDASVDLILAAQAFHWFDFGATLEEFRRILKPAGAVGLIWNERKTDSDFLQAYEAMLVEHAPEYSQVNHMNLTDQYISNLFDTESYKILSFDNTQIFNLDGFLGRVQSSSYTPAIDAPGYEKFTSRVVELFDQYEKDGQLSFDYDCKLYTGKVNRR